MCVTTKALNRSAHYTHIIASTKKPQHRRLVAEHLCKLGLWRYPKECTAVCDRRGAGVVSEPIANGIETPAHDRCVDVGKTPCDRDRDGCAGSADDVRGAFTNKHVHHGMCCRDAVSKHSKHRSTAVVRSVAVLNVHDEHGGKGRRCCTWKTWKQSTKDASNDVHYDHSNQKPHHNVFNVDDEDEIGCGGNSEMKGHGGKRIC